MGCSSAWQSAIVSSILVVTLFEYQTDWSPQRKQGICVPHDAMNTRNECLWNYMDLRVQIPSAPLREADILPAKPQSGTTGPRSVELNEYRFIQPGRYVF